MLIILFFHSAQNNLNLAVLLPYILFQQLAYEHVLQKVILQF